MKQSNLFRVISLECINKGMTQGQLASSVQRQSQGLWNGLRKQNLSTGTLIDVCDSLGLDLVIRNPSDERETILNKEL
jgi:DNA-binding phage protein